LIFDIETGALPLEKLKTICPPFSAPPHPGEFNPGSVKYGNAKKEDKRAEILEAAKAKHADACESYSIDVRYAEANYWAEIQDKGALSALTGEVLAIGYKSTKVAIDFVDEENTEAGLLARFWRQYQTIRSTNRKMVGFNISGFDIPFIVQRSWLLGIPVPDSVFSGPQRYLEPVFIDLMKFWSAGAWGNVAKLTVIAQAMGVGAKPEGINGGDFARLFRNPETRDVAIDYLNNDLEITFGVAERLGVV